MDVESIIKRLPTLFILFGLWITPGIGFIAFYFPEVLVYIETSKLVLFAATVTTPGILLMIASIPEHYPNPFTTQAGIRVAIIGAGIVHSVCLAIVAAAHYYFTDWKCPIWSFAALIITVTLIFKKSFRKAKYKRKINDDSKNT